MNQDTKEVTSKPRISLLKSIRWVGMSAVSAIAWLASISIMILACIPAAVTLAAGLVGGVSALATYAFVVLSALCAGAGVACWNLRKPEQSDEPGVIEAEVIRFTPVTA